MPRILVLHGRYQCAKSFSRRLGDPSQWLPAGFEAVFVEAPFEVNPPIRLGSSPRLRRKQQPCTTQQTTSDGNNNNRQEQRRLLSGVANLSENTTRNASQARKQACRQAIPQSQPRAWWRGSKDDESVSHDIDRTLQHIRDTLQQHDGKIDGVLGFSQGAAVAAMLCTNSASHVLDGWRPRYVSIVSGYLPLEERPQELMKSGFTKGVASLHMFGKQDLVTSPEQSEKLASMMCGETVSYDRGHAPPCAKMLSEIGGWMAKCEMDGNIQQQQ